VRLIVGVHHLELGGSQLNALDLAVATRDQGHDVAIFGNYTEEPGPVALLAEQAGLPVILVKHPAVTVGRARPMRPLLSRALVHAVREFRADVLHVYESSLALDAFHGPHVRLGTPIVTTIYGMGVPRWLPRYGEVIVGTQQLVETTAVFRARPTLIEPPINTDLDDARLVDAASFRAEHRLAADEIVVGVVSRLEPDMKAEGILRAIDAVRLLDNPRVRLVIVGGGPSFDDVAGSAQACNRALSREAVVMTGSMGDPRPAYAAFDVALGMGGSALRAMSFGRPLIVLGIRGFSKSCSPESIDYFLQAGFYGIGAGDLDPTPLADQVNELVADAERRRQLGAWGRALVLERFSLAAAASVLADVYLRALAEQASPRRRIRESLRVAGHKPTADLLPPSARRRIRRMLG
jgi:glycosyltransferase involved in cell wall biosynthesis